MTSNYQYNDLGEGQIRVLRLRRGSLGDPVDCELHTVKLNSPGPFEAISYAWGYPDYKKEEITCWGQPLHVSPSLYTALLHFRQEETDRDLWADAICIDQSNDSEKGRQVNIMGTIYSCATRVLVWLGTDTNNDIGTAIQLIKDVNKHFEENYVPSQDEVEPLHLIPSLPDNSPLLDVSRWQAFKNLLDRPWFGRVWVLQEVGLARSAMAFVGRSMISIDEIVQLGLLKTTRPDLYHIPVTPNVGRLCDAFFSIWSSFRGPGSWLQKRPILREYAAFHQRTVGDTFVDVLDTARKFEATDERDFVYAFLGHPTAKIKDGTALVSANYTRTYTSAELFQDVTSKLFTTTRSTYALNCVYHASQEDMEKRVSWVPQWNSGQPCMSIDPYQTFNASLASETGDLFSAERIGNRLKVSGFLFDTIILSSEQRLNSQDFEKQSLSDFKNPIEECWKLIEEPEVRRSRYHNRVQALLGPLILGTYPIMDALYADFYAYCREFCTPGFYESLNPSRGSAEGESPGGDWKRFLRRVRISNARKFFITRTGSSGLGPHIIQEGDRYCILFGSRTPFIIRRPGEESCYKLVGECYIHGLMSGEFVQGWRKGSLRVERQDIILD